MVGPIRATSMTVSPRTTHLVGGVVDSAILTIPARHFRASVAVSPCSPTRLKPCMQPETDRKIDSSMSIFRRLAASSPTAFEGSGFDGQGTRTATLCKASRSLIGPRIPSSGHRYSYSPNTVYFALVDGRTNAKLRDGLSPQARHQATARHSRRNNENCKQTGDQPQPVASVHRSGSPCFSAKRPFGLMGETS